MKVLLTAINAKYIHSNLAVYSLKANCGSYEPQVKLMEYSINQYPEEIFSEPVPGKGRCGLLFLLYMEYWNCGASGRVAEAGYARDKNLARWSGSFL